MSQQLNLQLVPGRVSITFISSSRWPSWLSVGLHWGAGWNWPRIESGWGHTHTHWHENDQFQVQNSQDSVGPAVWDILYEGKKNWVQFCWFLGFSKFHLVHFWIQKFLFPSVVSKGAKKSFVLTLPTWKICWTKIVLSFFFVRQKRCKKESVLWIF